MPARSLPGASLSRRRGAHNERSGNHALSLFICLSVFLSVFLFSLAHILWDFYLLSISLNPILSIADVNEVGIETIEAFSSEIVEDQKV